MFKPNEVACERKLIAMVIDTHAHVYPTAYLDALEAAGVDPATTAIARGLHADSTDADLRRRIKWMDKAGVDKQLLAVTPQYPANLATAEWINEEYCRIITDYPGRFMAYGAISLHDDPGPQLDRIAELGLCGVSIPTVLRDGSSLADVSHEHWWREFNRRSLVVNIHPTGSGVCSPLLNNYQLAWVNGAPVEDATMLLQLLKRDIPGRFPQVQLHVAHLGGDLPMLFQRIEDNYNSWGAFPASPQETLRRIYFDAANFYEPALRLAVEAYGASQIMAGSDHPYFQDDDYLRAFNYIRTAQLPDVTKQAILAGNVARLLGDSDCASVVSGA